MWCEFCGESVPLKDFEYLAENTVYEDPDVHIVHKDCEDPDGWVVAETYETHGDLRIVRVVEPS